MSISNYIKNNSSLKKIVHRLLIPKYEARPRLWVKWFINPFYHKRGSRSVIRRSVRMDTFPFNKFELGSRSIIEDFSTINNGVGDVIIGDHSFIGISDVIIGPVTIGNNVMLAQNITISGLNHNYTDVTLPIHAQNVSTNPIIIGDDCWICANAVITAGVVIGKHSVIAAGAVVTKNIPAFSVAAGNPAKVIKTYDTNTNEWKRV